ncbi:MAG: ybjI [Herbinix sp.]|jgi:Cof subfamily protein (haloacid dehalogenase superfamily)|nr:ybjI [Herbinix sp.]
MIKLVVSDLDGTLLRKEKQRLEPETLELIRCLQEQGVIFAAASGRQYPNMYRMFESAIGNMYFICENGSLVMHQGKVCSKKSIDRNVGMELINDILDTEDAEVLISGETTSYIIPKKEAYEDFLIDLVKNNITTITDARQIQEDFIKISAFWQGNNNIPKDLEEHLRRKYSDRLQAVVSGNEWLDFIPLDAGKGNALTYLMDDLGISKEETMVFGDNENDISMLLLTDNSYVMSHASDNIKQFGKKECRYVDDVLKLLIEESCMNYK